jgi:hypothetical protein
MAYFPCLAHNLQLVVKDGFKLSEIYEKLILKVSRDIVNRAKRSQIIAECLREFNKKMLYKNVTRWNSILFMITSVLKISPNEFKPIKEAMPTTNAKQKAIQRKFCLTQVEREMLTELKEVLEYFELATNEFQANKVSISRVLPAIDALKRKLSSDLDSKKYTRDLRIGFYDKLCTRFDPIIEGNLFLISTYLDPNFGERSFSPEKRKEVSKMIKNKLKSQDPLIQTENITNKSNQDESHDSNYIFYEIEQEEFEPADEYDFLIDKYLDFVRKTKHPIDCLSFWKMYADQLSNLSTVAKQYLGVQVSSAGVERMFSISGHIFSSKRRRMGTKLFSELVFLKLNEQFM